MKILQNIDNVNLLVDLRNEFSPDFSKSDGIVLFEKEILKDVINKPINYELVPYSHNDYLFNDLIINDICFKFFFFNNSNPPTHNGGLNYEFAGIGQRENARFLKENSTSFFKLDFYETINNEIPTFNNKRKIFSKILTVPLGEKVFLNSINDFNFVPVFIGNNNRNKENNNIYWFQNDETYSNDVFYFSAKFYNGNNNTIYSFSTKEMGFYDTIDKEGELYYKIILNKKTRIYSIHNGTSFIGQYSSPIIFYEYNQNVPLSQLPPQEETDLEPIDCNASPNITDIVYFGSDIVDVYFMVEGNCKNVYIEASTEIDQWEDSLSFIKPCVSKITINLPNINVPWYFRMAKICEDNEISDFSSVFSHIFSTSSCQKPNIESIEYFNQEYVRIKYDVLLSDPCSFILVTYGEKEDSFLYHQILSCEESMLLLVNVDDANRNLYFKIKQVCEINESDYSEIYSYKV